MFFQAFLQGGDQKIFACFVMLECHSTRLSCLFPLVFGRLSDVTLFCCVFIGAALFSFSLDKFKC